MSGAAAPDAHFWSLVQGRLDEGTLERGTIMGRPCVRRDGDFVATVHSKTGALVVKLSEARVRALIDEGVGEPFAPAGRVFREWLAVAQPDEPVWSELIDEAVALRDG